VAETVAAILDSELGVSNPIGNCDRLQDAFREARLALAHANSTRHAVFYAEVADRLPWLPQNLDEAMQTFRHFLGCLTDHDEESRASLLFTLKIFLDQNRSWQASAEKLHIHKASLVYRIRHIEELIGRSLSNTADVTAMWLALQAAETLGLLQMRVVKA
jgi:PucR family transcriptional regulator, purine catabolism regulatory protein